MLPDCILSFWVGSSQCSTKLTDSIGFYLLLTGWVLTLSKPGMTRKGSEATWNKVVSFWTCTIPTSPHQCGSNQSVSAGAASPQVFSVAVLFGACGVGGGGKCYLLDREGSRIWCTSDWVVGGLLSLGQRNDKEALRKKLQDHIKLLPTISQLLLPHLVGSTWYNIYRGHKEGLLHSKIKIIKTSLAYGIMITDKDSIYLK